MREKGREKDRQLDRQKINPFGVASVRKAREKGREADRQRDRQLVHSVLPLFGKLERERARQTEFVFYQGEMMTTITNTFMYVVLISTAQCFCH